MTVVITFLMGVLLALAAARVAGILGSPVRTGGPQPAPRGPSPVHDDLAAVIGVLPLGGLLVGPHDEVVKVNTQGMMMRLARGTRVGFPGLLDRVRQVYRTNTEYLGNVIQDRPPGIDGVEFSTRMLPLGRGSVLIMAEGEATTRHMDAVRRDFVANISHGLKTPIGAVGILAETIETASKDPQQVTHFARHLQRESARPAKLVGQIIELSRLQSSDPMLDREVVDMEEIVDEAIERTREAVKARRINPVHATVPCARVLGDRWQLIDAVVNLVQNAIDYSDNNARVVVAAAQVRDEDNDHVETMVTDSGVGIPQEDQKRIFKRFYQVDHGRSRESGGARLGLSIVRHTALAYKGNVRVWPRPRRGSTFTLRLPAHQDGAVNGETRGEWEMTRILIIKNEGSYREALTFMFDKEGFDVVAAADGESGLAKYKRNGADLMLLDLMLPEIPGTETCRRLRARGGVTIVMVPARDSEMDKVAGLEIGADDYVTKLFPHRELVARIRAILRRGHDATLISEVVEMDGVRIDVERHQVLVDGQGVRLALREFELLELLLRNTGRVMIHGRITDCIQGSDYVGDTKALGVHVRCLRNKIEREPSKPPRVITVRGLGHKFRG